MRIFKDLITGDELSSDTFPHVLLDGAVYKMTGKQITLKGGVDASLIGSNPSEEDQADEVDEDSVSGINIVLANRLVEMPYGKKDYTKYIKTYMKTIKEKLAESNPDEVDVFMKGCQKFVKEMLAEFDEYQFFVGESMSIEGMVVLVKWDEVTPYVYLFKHGLDEEKV